MYTQPEAGFNWDCAPGRLAVLLDDIGFYQSDVDHYDRAWRTDNAWHTRLMPFSHSFVGSLVRRRSKLEELTVLVLPPLAGRPNCTAHRFEFAEGVEELVDMGEFLTTQLRDRGYGVVDWPSGTDGEAAESPIVRVRHALCELWPSSDANIKSDVSWSTALREGVSAPAYADMEFGEKPALPPPPPGVDQFSFHSSSLPWGISSSRRKRIQAIRRDLKALRQPFCTDLGLGPYVLWEEKRYMCVTGMFGSGIAYEADRQLLWLSGHEDELPKLESPRPLTDFDFNSFLAKDFETKFDPENWQAQEIERRKREEEEEEEEEEERDPWKIESLRFNGLYYWSNSW